MHRMLVSTGSAADRSQLGLRCPRPAARALRWSLCILALCVVAPLSAQELEPRAYSRSPVGTNFVSLGYGYSDGDVLFDPTIPITNAHATTSAASVAYSNVFGLFGNQTSVALGIPYAWTHATGEVGTSQREVATSGFANARLRLSMLVLGGEAAGLKEFATLKPQPTLGVTLTIEAPTGQYDPTRLVNLGTNRWAFKPEVGASYPWGRWQFDLSCGVWFFTDNDDFYGGHQRTQRPLGSYQAHVSYTFRPGLWLALDQTYYSGGAASIDNGPEAGRENNSRVGVTLSVPMSKRNSVKLLYSDGAFVRTGGSYRSISVALQHVWFD
jgi:hypothetical protein